MATLASLLGLIELCMLASRYFPADDRLLRRGIVGERVTSHQKEMIARQIAKVVAQVRN
jgi:hypothetical protein